MTESICCNYARTAIRSIAQSQPVQKGATKTFQSSGLQPTLTQYYQHFKDFPAMHLTKHATKLTTIKAILMKFNEHWSSQEHKTLFLDEFCIEKWDSLATTTKAKHTLRQCRACMEEFPELTSVWVNT